MIERLKKNSEYFIYFCGILLFASVLLISADVVLRKFFSFSFGGADELSSYVLGILISWSLSYVLFEKMHIRIDIIHNKVSLRFKHLFDVIAMSFTFCFSTLLTYYSFDVLYTSILKNSTANTPLGTPLWIPQGIWWLGFLFFSLVVFVLLLKAIKSLYDNKKNKYTGISKEKV
ncbi:MAG: C4-dicarboxylate ABC transporter permease [Arcobacter sp.]|nr:TRAP transporter small permease [Campylobacteraceae bacterium]PHR72980.1 MAG: C4-dicarboxylate ABC transporter permease [Arcobacter sp.]